MMYICDINCRPVDNTTSVMSIIKSALEHRCESATLVHEHSSRSHLIVIATVTTDTNMERTSPVPDNGNYEGQKRKATRTKEGEALAYFAKL